MPDLVLKRAAILALIRRRLKYEPTRWTLLARSPVALDFERFFIHLINGTISLTYVMSDDIV